MGFYNYYLYKFALYRLNNGQLAEDLAPDTFLSVIEERDANLDCNTHQNCELVHVSF